MKKPSETNVGMHAYVIHVPGITYEYRAYTLIENNFNRGWADAYGEKQASVRMVSLIGSKLAKLC